jgi:class 3 adenylate cyclase
MQALTRPIIERHNGSVIKYEADNLLATFREPAEAVHAGIGINLAIASGGERFEVAIGIDHGRFILIDGAECYGDPVNVACKLGEDIAHPGEVLLTQAAAKQLGDPPPFALRQQKVSVSGLELEVYAVDTPAAR